ncbi:hypothetical protein Pla108_15690 [Botrimarina colliarenosi]|uniref:Uncharacterized protein n=1 Tax=Botrimarina colliarenosi TaxID=2528001 RepID=A0A5C6AMB6_9BACT|nr:hypothetical protein [Botrimarina colliarenosi]TWU00617.1 hypothetical protein Pla108_15690 [Botrimarina colliarenosi]
MSNKPTPFQTCYRLTIMVGTLAVGSMAAYRYGPEPAELAELIDRAASLVAEVPSRGASDPSAMALTEAPAAELDLLQPAPALPSPPVASSDWRHYDTAVQPASALAPLATPSTDAPPPADLEPLERERLTAPLLAVGATRADVTAWGRGAATVYRATASAPVGEVGGGLERQFDAVGETPEAAVAELAAEIRTASLR